MKLLIHSQTSWCMRITQTITWRKKDFIWHKSLSYIKWISFHKQDFIQDSYSSLSNRQTLADSQGHTQASLKVDSQGWKPYLLHHRLMSFTAIAAVNIQSSKPYIFANTYSVSIHYKAQGVRHWFIETCQLIHSKFIAIFFFNLLKRNLRKQICSEFTGTHFTNVFS